MNFSKVFDILLQPEVTDEQIKEVYDYSKKNQYTEGRLNVYMEEKLGYDVMSRFNAAGRTVPTESEVKKFNDQIEELEQSGEEESLLNSIREFHAEEVEHEMIAREEMDEISPMMNIFKDVVKIGCKTAIKISEKI